MPKGSLLFNLKMSKNSQSAGLSEARKAPDGRMRGNLGLGKNRNIKIFESHYERDEFERQKAGIADPVAAKAQRVDLGGNEDKVNFEAELRRRRNRTRTKFAGESGMTSGGGGGYGGSTQLG